MTYERDRLPDPVSYYEAEGLRLIGPRSAKWKTTECRFHGGSDSMRVNIETGAFKCMNCGIGGGNVLAHQIQAHGLEFVEAAKALGAWVEDGRPEPRKKPAPLPPRAALEVLSFEATLTAVAAGNISHGIALTEADRARLMTAVNRINRLAEAYQ